MTEGLLDARMARPDDYPHFVRLVEELGTGDPVPPSATWLADFRPTMIMFEDEGAVVGYVWTHPLERVGYVRHVALAATHRGRGLGRAMMGAAARFLRERGCAEWCLNVRPSNTPAVRLYERCGMRTRYTSASLHLPWSMLDALPGDGETTIACAIEPADDATVEATFALPAGQLAHARARVNRALVGLRDRSPDAPWVGLAQFDPTFPGAATFRVQRPSLARPLLEALLPLRRPEHAHLRVRVEDDQALAEFLLAHGGTLVVHTQHMAGPLPPP
ncbi:MAG: GNAT family N-acetyltransferase [Sandaracinaceae bacterium]|nr:GNAT family N-acetyltransferase [Sandaracinaceae bacterium]